MNRLLQIILLLLLAFIMGCTRAATLGKAEHVTMVLTTGEKIKAEILDIDYAFITFEATDKKKAYDFGEKIAVERVESIKLRDGTIMTVNEYAAYRRDRTRIATTAPSSQSQPIGQASGDFQFDQVSAKPIAEMSDNEYDYFKMVRDRELETDEAPGAQTTSIKRSAPQNYPMPAANASREQLQDFVESIIAAGLAPVYLNYLADQRNLTETESEIRRMIQRDPQWQERQEDLEYVDRQARRAFSRAFSYNPEQLKSDLGLRFDENERLDYVDLIEQLHRDYGEDLRARDYDALVDVLGDSGARAVRAILRDYNAWRFTVSN